MLGRWMEKKNDLAYALHNENNMSLIMTFVLLVMCFSDGTGSEDS